MGSAMGKGEARRMRPAKVVLPLVIGLLVLVAVGMRMCNPAATVDQAKAVSIASTAAGFPVTEYEVRFIRQGISSEPAWVVGVRAADGRAKTFVINGRDGSIDRVESSSG